MSRFPGPNTGGYGDGTPMSLSLSFSLSGGSVGPLIGPGCIGAPNGLGGPSAGRIGA
jgi:hypothetical protein